MNILFAHNEYGIFTGEERAQRVLSELLQQHGHRVEWLRRSSADIHSLSDKTRAFFSGLYSISARREMEQCLRESHIDLVQVQNLYPFLSPSVLEACRGRVPVVMRCPNYRLFCPDALHLSHGKVCERCLGPGRELWCVLKNCEENFSRSVGYAVRNAAARLTRGIVGRVHVFVVLSEFQKERFIRGGIPPERLEVLPNTIPLQEMPQPDGSGGDLITFVGRVAAEKGIGTFLKAAAALPSYRFAVAGAYDERSGYLSNLPDNVEYTGFLEKPELDHLIRRSRILVFPSRWFEGFPNAVLGAMAHGKPVIASRIGALPEIVEDETTGLLFEPGDISDLAEKIDSLYQDTEMVREMGRAARRKVETVYHPDCIYERLVGIYHKAAGLFERHSEKTEKSGG